MWGRRSFRHKTELSGAISALLLLDLVASLSSSPTPWKTLHGNAPVVIAKGGFSGLFPDSSYNAYMFSYETGSNDTISWCDIKLTKDGVGVCLPELTLNNCTDISFQFPDGQKRYTVNGVEISGWFPVDYTLKDLSKVSLVQGVYTRTQRFDEMFAIETVENVAKYIGSAAIWLNVEHEMFYTSHNLSMRNYIISLSKRITASYISSPEVGFLKSIASGVKKSNKKLIFRFLDEDFIEPSTSITYGSLLDNLTFIKSFASGILVPKRYIWPETSDLYLQPHTSIVSDAHTEGLEIFASDFANDAPFSYNYSSDPIAEYRSFIDNGDFSVDGVLTDFPITAWEAIGCFSNMTKVVAGHEEKPLILSHNGASGIYPDCTDLAYEQAVKDGADVIDCPIQLTQDGIPICMSSINLMNTTTATKSSLRSRLSVIPELQNTAGIFTFNSTWEEIRKELKPLISSPDSVYGLSRNPRYSNAGNFMKLSDFLNFAKDKSLFGVLISIENAVFLAEKLGFSVTDAVISVLKESGYNNRTIQKIMIQSSDSSVLMKFKQQTDYDLVYMVDESIRDADASSVTKIKEFANSVAIGKRSVYPDSSKFIVGQNQVVRKLQSVGLSVYVYLLRNEFLSQAWDFFSDPVVEINTFVQGAGVDGIITDFPGTANAYKRNTCSKLGDDKPNYSKPVEVGILLQLMYPQALPPALPPLPILDIADVVEPPLPPASRKPTISETPSQQPSGAPTFYFDVRLTVLTVFSGWVLLI